MADQPLTSLPKLDSTPAELFRARHISHGVETHRSFISYLDERRTTVLGNPAHPMMLDQSQGVETAEDTGVFGDFC